MVTLATRREAVAHLREAFEVSERRACRVAGADRSSVRYRSVRPDDKELRERLRALSRERCRFGYRWLHLLLAREGGWIQISTAPPIDLAKASIGVRNPRHLRDVVLYVPVMYPMS